jgi:hypothetical protein
VLEKEKIISLFKAVGIDPNNSYSLDDGSIEIEPEYKLNPEDFIRFAEIDIEQNDDRSLINSLSNAKRAIDCRTDMIIEALNLSPKRLKMSKFEILKEMGVLAPRIIDKIRKARNLLEHEYSLPEKGIVEDAVDVAMLYEAASQRVFHLFPELIHIANNNCEAGKGGYLFNDEINILFRGDGIEIDGHKNSQRLGDKILIPISSDLYFPLIKVYVTAHLERKKHEALKNFYITLGYNTSGSNKPMHLSAFAPAD